MNEQTLPMNLFFLLPLLLLFPSHLTSHLIQKLRYEMRLTTTQKKEAIFTLYATFKVDGNAEAVDAAYYY